MLVNFLLLFWMEQNNLSSPHDPFFIELSLDLLTRVGHLDYKSGIIPKGRMESYHQKCGQLDYHLAGAQESVLTVFFRSLCTQIENYKPYICTLLPFGH